MYATYLEYSKPYAKYQITKIDNNTENYLWAAKLAGMQVP